MTILHPVPPEHQLSLPVRRALRAVVAGDSNAVETVGALGPYSEAEAVAGLRYMTRLFVERWAVAS